MKSWPKLPRFSKTYLFQVCQLFLCKQGGSLFLRSSWHKTRSGKDGSASCQLFQSTGTEQVLVCWLLGRNRIYRNIYIYIYRHINIVLARPLALWTLSALCAIQNPCTLRGRALKALAFSEALLARTGCQLDGRDREQVSKSGF